MADEPKGSETPKEEPTTPEEQKKGTDNIQIPSVEIPPVETPSEPKPGEPQSPVEEKPPEVKPDDTPVQPQEFTVGTHKFKTVEELRDFANKTYGRLGGAVGALKATYPNIKDEDIETVLATGKIPIIPEASKKAESKAVEKLTSLGYSEKDAQALMEAQKILMEESGVITRGSPELDPDLTSFKKKATAFVKTNPEAAKVADVMDNIFYLNYAKGILLEPEEIYKRAKLVMGEVTPAKTEEQKKKEEAQRNQAAGMPGGGTPPSKEGGDETLGENILKSAGLL